MYFIKNKNDMKIDKKLEKILKSLGYPGDK